MPLETATYISQLNSSNPVSADNVSQGDDHLRLIKAVLQAQFPNLGTGAVTGTAAQINAATTAAGGGTLTNPQGLNGTLPMGALVPFVRDPGSSLCARGGVATGSEQFILLDGSTYAQSKFTNLGSSTFVTVSAPNFTVDNLTDTNRFLRAAGGSLTSGTKQSNQNAAHTHTLTDPGHNHGHNESPHSHSITDPGHTHSTAGEDTVSGSPTGFGVIQQSNAGAQGLIGASIGTSTTGITVNSATTGVTNIANTTGITMASQGGTEARPESYAAWMCIKT